MNKITKVGIAAFALGTVLLGAATASATHVWGNSSGAYHWARTSNPFTIKLGDNVSAAWDGYLATTATAWGASSVLNTTIVSGLGGKSCKATNGRIEVCNRSYGYNGWLGLAQIYISGNHITKGTAKMNDSYFNLPQYNNADEKLHVMCQEVGHLFGLGHTSEDGTSQGTCMDYSSDPSSTLPNAHDYALLEQIYAHLDSSTTIAASTAQAAGAEEDSNDPKAWGKEIYRSSNGRSSIFEQDLGNGQRILRHVYWTHERAHKHHEE